jgi:hypothetical protein
MAIGISLCESVQEGIIALLRPIRILQEYLYLLWNVIMTQMLRRVSGTTVAI